MKKGIDVSSHNGRLDWSKLKAQGVEFALIRIGYGSDSTTQDDSQAKYNMAECERLGIPYGVYIYSYAFRDYHVASEVAHTLRMIKGRKPELGVFFDMEDADGYKVRAGINVYNSNELLTGFCIKFCEAIEEAGYKAGVYANLDWFKNVLDIKALDKWLIWLAQWQVKEPAMKCDIWQYTSDETFNGMSGRFDANYLYDEEKPVKAEPAKGEVADDEATLYTVIEVEKGDTLSEIAQRFNTTVDELVKLNNISNPHLIYAGQELKVKGEAAAINEEYYEIKKYDTLTSIAKKFNTTIDKLVKLNNIDNPNLIYAGDKIRIK